MKERERVSTGTPPMAELIFLVGEDPDGGFVASAVGHSIFTQADTEAELRAMVGDAVLCHFEDAERLKLVRLQFVGDEVRAC
jgi:predicted RNase H-like HicB family nuclease